MELVVFGEICARRRRHDVLGKLAHTVGRAAAQIVREDADAEVRDRERLPERRAVEVQV